MGKDKHVPPTACHAGHFSCLYHYLVSVGLIQLSLHASFNCDFHDIELIHKGVPTLLPFSIILRLHYWHKLYTVGKKIKSLLKIERNITLLVISIIKFLIMTNSACLFLPHNWCTIMVSNLEHFVIEYL